MGENIQSIVAKAFKHYSNAAYNRRFMVPDLFSRIPFVYYHSYRCRPSNGFSLRPGEQVVVILRNHKPEIWQGNHSLGEIEGEDAAEMVAALEAKVRGSQWLIGTLEEECGLDNHFSVKLEGGPLVVEGLSTR